MSAFQGFDIKLNLRENIDDRDVLNNLGGAPIADDISLFLNNLRNTSTLEVTSAQISGSFIRFNQILQPFVYTNNTEIKVGNATFFVGDSNTVNEFRIYTNKELTNLVTNPPTGNYIRSDAVSFNDITQLVPFRDPLVIENIAESQNGESEEIGGEEGDQLSLRPNPYISFVRVYREIRTGFDQGISSYINTIDDNLGLFSLRKTNSISSIVDFSSNNSLSLSGNILLKDPNGINDTSVSTVSGPGIFILDPETEQATRIFSSNENVWTENGNDLVADTREIVVGNFIFDDGVRILRKNNLPDITAESAVVTDFTHFATVTVNGEEYSICLL